MLDKQQKNKKGKKVHAVFYQVGFILDIWLWHGDLYRVSPLSRFTAHLLPVSA
jgi:hypothetical protein